MSLKVLKFISILIAALLLLTLATTAVMNALDSRIDPKIQEILGRVPQHSEQQKRAYYFLLGLHAGESKEPEAKGRTLWEQWERSRDPKFWEQNFVKKNDPWFSDFPGCGPKQEICTSADIQKDPALAERIKTHETRIYQYVHLMEYGEGATLFRGNDEVPFVGVRGLPTRQHKEFILQLADWMRRGGQERVFDLIALSNLYMRSFMREGDLLDATMALHNMRQNGEFLRRELEANPKLRLRPEVVESFAFPNVDQFLQTTLEIELKSMANIVGSVKDVRGLVSGYLPEADAFVGDILKWIPARLLFKPNQTLNMYYQLANEALITDCKYIVIGDNDKKCLASAGWLHPRWPWEFLNNPVGRGLVSLTTPEYAQRRTRISEKMTELLLLKQQFANHL